MQIAFALVVLKTRAGQVTFQTLGDLINRLLGFAGVGSSEGLDAGELRFDFARVVSFKR